MHNFSGTVSTITPCGRYGTVKLHTKIDGKKFAVINRDTVIEGKTMVLESEVTGHGSPGSESILAAKAMIGSPRKGGNFKFQRKN